MLLLALPASARWKLITSNPHTGSRWSIDYGTFKLGQDSEDVRHKWVTVDVKIEGKSGTNEYRLHAGGKDSVYSLLLRDGKGYAPSETEAVPLGVLNAAFKIIPDYTASFEKFPTTPQWKSLPGRVQFEYDVKSVKRLNPGYELWIRSWSGQGPRYSETVYQMRIGVNPRQVEVIDPVPRRSVIQYNPRWPWDKVVQELKRRFG